MGRSRRRWPGIGDRRQRRPADPDRAGDVKVDDVGARLRIGRDDRLPERACSRVMKVRHREGCQELAVLENLQSANS